MTDRRRQDRAVFWASLCAGITKGKQPCRQWHGTGSRFCRFHVDQDQTLW